jgi:hypothetical protein
VSVNLVKSPAAYLETVFNRHWMRHGEVDDSISDDDQYLITNYWLPPYIGSSNFNNMIGLKLDHGSCWCESPGRAPIIEGWDPLDPIDSIPSTVKEWERNTGKTWH